MKRFLQLAFFAFCGMNIHAQSYNFSVQNNPYTNLTGSTSLNGTTTWDDPSFAIPIGFNFNFYNSAVTSLYIPEDGVGALLLPVPVATGTHFAMLPFGADIIDRGYDAELDEPSAGSLSTISYKLDGTAGSRILKIEWKNVGFFGDIFENGTSTDFANFQMWLYETSNIIEVRFGPSSIVNADASFDGFSGPTVGFFPEVDFEFGEINSNGVVLSGPANNPTANTTTEELYLTGMPSNGITYRFAPSSLQTNESDKKNFSIFPNPVSTLLKMQYADGMKIEGAEVVDLTGKVVRKIESDYNAINVSDLANGVYMLRVKTATGVLTHKFVKI